MESMNQKQEERWQRIRAKGKQRFIFTRTVVWGSIPIVSAILWRTIKFVYSGQSDFQSMDYGEIIFKACAFMIWGYFQAKHEWNSQEKRYKSSSEIEITIPKNV